MPVITLPSLNRECKEGGLAVRNGKELSKARLSLSGLPEMPVINMALLCGDLRDLRDLTLKAHTH